MTRKTYAQALAAVKPDPTRFRHLTPADLRAAIAECTAGLRGPMSDAERAMAHADRADMRAALADASPKETTP